MQRPIALPRMPASANGVSKQRSGPNRSRNPAVARKTPPARPTSSPITITDESRSSSTWRQSLIASTIERSAKLATQLVEIGSERRRRIDVRVREQERDIRRRLGLRRLDALAHRVRRLRLDRGGEIVVQDPSSSQVTREAPDTLALPFLLDPLEIDVRTGIVGGRVRRNSVRDRLDQRRAVTVPRTRNRFAGRLEAGKHIRAVDAHPGHPIADRLVRKRLRAGLRLDGRRDRPTVVVAEQDERCAGDRCEVRAFVKRTFRRRAVAEEHDRRGTLALQLLSPRETRRVRNVRRDRDADRRNPIVLGIPPAGGMTTPP